MTYLIESVWFTALLVVMAIASLGVVARLLAQPIVNRMRLLRHIDDDGAREAALEERVRKLNGCVDLVAEIEEAETEQEVMETVIVRTARVLSADAIAVSWGSNLWTGPRGSFSLELEQRIEDALKGKIPRDEERLLMETVRITHAEEPGWLVAARASSGAPFAPDTSAIMPSVAAVVRLALSCVQALRRSKAERDLTELSEEALRRAELSLSRTRQLGLQGELAHHLVRELTGPMTGVVGLAQYLAQQADSSQRGEIEELAAESLRCRRILEQFAAASLADVGQQGREVVDVALVLREVMETTRPRFRAADITMSVRLPEQSVLLHTNPTTLSRLLSDLILASLEHCTAGESPGAGELSVRLHEENEALSLDFIAVRGDRAPEETPPIITSSGQAQLWNNLDTINLAVLQSMSRCLGGVLYADVKGERLHARLRLAAGRAAIPLHAGVLSPYGPMEEDSDPDRARTPSRSVAESPELDDPSRTVAEEAPEPT